MKVWVLIRDYNEGGGELEGVFGSSKALDTYLEKEGWQLSQHNDGFAVAYYHRPMTSHSGRYFDNAHLEEAEVKK